jgi:hypothetical protein
MTSLGALGALGALVAACGSDAKPAAAGEGGDGGVLLADGSATDGATQNADGAVADAAASDGGEVAVCNALLAEGSLVGQTTVAGAQPAPAGGHIFTGTYLLTQRTSYGGLPPDGLFVTRELLIDATTIDVVEGTSMSVSAVPSLRTTTSTYVTLDTSVFSTKESCPGPPHVTNVRYTAGGPELTLFVDNESSELYVLQ